MGLSWGKVTPSTEEAGQTGRWGAWGRRGSADGRMVQDACGWVDGTEQSEQHGMGRTDEQRRAEADRALLMGPMGPVDGSAGVALVDRPG